MDIAVTNRISESNRYETTSTIFKSLALDAFHTCAANAFNLLIANLSFNFPDYEQFQSSSRAVPAQFQSSFRVNSERFQSRFETMPQRVSWLIQAQFSSDFRAISEQFQSRFGGTSDQQTEQF